MTKSPSFTTANLRGLLLGLIAIELMLVAIYIVTQTFAGPSRLWPLFDLDGEANVPAWFSSMQLLLIGLVFLFASSSPLREVDGLAGLIRAIGAGFVFLSLDEAATLHEKITEVFRQTEWAPRFRGGHGIWLFAYAAIGIGLLTIIRRSLWKLSRLYREDVFRVGGGLSVLLAGAVGLEAIGYQTGIEHQSGIVRTLQVALEEFCEMAGGTLVLGGALRFALRERVPALAPATPRHATEAMSTQ